MRIPHNLLTIGLLFTGQGLVLTLSWAVIGSVTVSSDVFMWIGLGCTVIGMTVMHLANLAMNRARRVWESERILKDIG